jgi:hypothetical protein
MTLEGMRLEEVVTFPDFVSGDRKKKQRKEVEMRGRS